MVFGWRMSNILANPNLQKEIYPACWSSNHTEVLDSCTVRVCTGVHRSGKYFNRRAGTCGPVNMQAGLSHTNLTKILATYGKYSIQS